MRQKAIGVPDASPLRVRRSRGCSGLLSSRPDGTAPGCRSPPGAARAAIKQSQRAGGSAAASGTRGEVGLSESCGCFLYEPPQVEKLASHSPEELVRHVERITVGLPVVSRDRP